MLSSALTRYRRVLAIPAVRQVLLLGVLVRMPVAATGLALTFHAVLTLHVSWALAGLLTTATTLAGAISAPLRGRLLDRRGLRRTLAPCLVVNLVVWAVAPFVGYLWLLALATLAGLFLVPVFSIVRQAVVAETTTSTRQAALSLDSVLVEVGFAVGPLVATWLATSWSTRGCLITLQALAVLGGLALLVRDPRIVPEGHEVGAVVARGTWFTPAVAVVLVASAAVSFILASTEVGAVALLREWARTSDTGWVMATWAAGSMIGGLVYGALHRGVHVLTLLGVLALVSLPAAWASGPPVLAVLVTLAGLACAPSMASSAATMSELVPAGAMGEAMGWHGSAITLGGAVGAPASGWAIDRSGGGAAFLLAAALGLTISLLGSLAVAGRRRARGAGAASGPAQPVQEPSAGDEEAPPAAATARVAQATETVELSSAPDAVRLEPPPLDPRAARDRAARP